MKTFFLLVCVPVIALAQRPSDTSALVDSWAVAYGFEPELIHAIIEVESGGNVKAISSAGAAGLMQLMPATAALLKGRRLSQEELTDADTNITLGVRYLNDMIREMGSVEKALLAYNAGPGAVRKWGGVPAYYTHVMRAHHTFLAYRAEGRTPRLEIAQLVED